jgi:hypothetical protein
MKMLNVVLAVTSFALGALCVTQWRNLGTKETRLAAAQAEIEAANKQVEELVAAGQRLEQEKRELLSQAAQAAVVQPQAKPAPLKAVEPAAAEPGPATNTAAGKDTEKDGTGLRTMLASMMKDPETRKFIRDQQRQMMDQLYGPLVKQMGLTSEEGERFKDFLADSMMQGAEKASSIFGPSTNRAELFKGIAADQKNSEEQMKSLLGEDRFNLYKEYQQSVGERTQLTLFKQQNSGTDYPVSDIQIEQLLNFTKQEKQGLTAMGQQFPATGSGQDPANLDAMLSPEQSEKFIQSQETLNQRVYERAKTVLSPQQLEAYQKFQATQLQTLRLGFSMARKLMVPAQGE